MMTRTKRGRTAKDVDEIPQEEPIIQQKTEVSSSTYGRLLNRTYLEGQEAGEVNDDTNEVDDNLGSARSECNNSQSSASDSSDTSTSNTTNDAGNNTEQ